MIHRAQMGDPKELERVLGRQIHPDALLWEPVGARLLVALDDIPDTIGDTKIVVPGPEVESVSTGVVVACGPRVGEPGPWPFGLECDDPADLLYQQVVFGRSVGSFLELPYYRPRDDDDKAIPVADKILMMTGRDIYNVVWTPEG